MNNLGALENTSSICAEVAETGTNTTKHAQRLDKTVK